MADECGFGKLSNDADHTREILHENRLLEYDGQFNDPEEFVDRVSDDGLLLVLI